MRIRQIIVIAMLFILLIITGCWDSKELDQRSMIGGIGIDINNETKKFKVISQIVPSEAAKAALAGPSSGDSELIWNLVTEGETIAGALFKTTAITGRDPSFSHTRVIIISEALARKGIEDALDFLRRSEEIRRRSWILITNEDMEEVFNSQNKLTVIPSYGLGLILQDGNVNADIPAINLHKFGKKASCDSSCAYAPIVEVHEMGGEALKKTSDEKSSGNSGSGSSGGSSKDQDKKELIIKDTAVFREFRLIGRLNKQETRGLMFANNDIRSTIVSAKSPNNPSKKIDIVVNMFSSRVKPSLVDGSFVMNIKVKIDGIISESHDSSLSTSKPDVMEQIAEQLNKVIEKEITAAIKKAQSFKSDIFDFGDYIFKDYPREWKDIKDNWQEEFTKIDFKVDFITNVRWGGRIEVDGN